MTVWLTKAFKVALTVTEKLLLLVITLSTVYAILLEVLVVVRAGEVLLSDILLMFIYLEVLAMARLYLEQGSVPVRYPIYIAIIALARYLTLAMKDLQALSLFWIAMSVLLLVLATVLLKVGNWSRFRGQFKQD